MSRILVLLGTDHHPFMRLTDWADSWALQHPQDEILVQHGYSPRPQHATAVDFLAPEELARRVRATDVVVCHGGPGTMADALRAGRRPVLVPRDPDRGEHVDGHQLRFGTWAGARGLARTVPDVAGLDAAVTAELDSPVQPEGLPSGRGATAAQRLSQMLTEPSRVGPVVYIAGSGRSGSTILERVLGQTSRVATLGEVVHLWSRGIGKNELCGCGTAFSDCPFWTSVGRRAFGGWAEVDLDRVSALAARVDRQRWIPATASPLRPRGLDTALREYADLYVRVYDAALAESGAQVAVDSSKHPSLAFALSHTRELDLRILHLVRDSMGVSHSWSKSVLRPEAVSAEDAEMKRYSAPQSAGMWMTTNLEVELLRVRGLPTTRMAYEDFVRQPQLEIGRMWEELDLPGTTPDLVDDDSSIHLTPNHTVAGNPSRFTTGSTRLSADTAWTTALPARERRVLGVLTGPLRRRYGYQRRV